MGREIKRVSLNFSWPRGKVWKGFLNPHYRPCQACGGNGNTVAAGFVDEIVQALMQNRKEDPELDLLTGGLAGRAPRPPFGHDSCDSWAATKKIIQVAGLCESWGTCQACDGEGVDSAVRERYEAWTQTEPPTGDGYQLWETVSEGSPVSPVFATPEELATWLTVPDNDTSITRGTTRAQWLGMIIGPGCAPSLIADNKGVRAGTLT